MPRWGANLLHGVLFDLDGTLLDTAADIAEALNRTLAEYGIREFAVAEVSRMVGRGSPMLLEHAAAMRGRSPDAAEKAAMLERFFHHYGALEENDESAARPYAGAADTLRRLHESGVKTGVVTNKHRRFADHLLRRLDLMQWVDLLVGGDTCERRKPDPLPLLFACRTLGIEPQAALMVGDSINDVRAARAAGIPIVCVPYGYNEGNDPRSLDCDAMLETLADLPRLLWPD